MPKKVAIAMLPIDVVIVYFILLWVVDDSDFPPIRLTRLKLCYGSRSRKLRFFRGVDRDDSARQRFGRHLAKSILVQ